MKNFTIVLALLLTAHLSASAQKFITKTGHIKFFSTSPMEDIEAVNNQVTSILDAASGEVVFSLLMKGFHFEKALMEEHFNEKYVHSDKFPKSTFKGRLADFDASQLREGDPLTVPVAGVLSLHGIDKEMTAEATLEMRDGKIAAVSVFPLTLADFDITIPSVVRNNIAKVVEVTVTMEYEPYNQ